MPESYNQVTIVSVKEDKPVKTWKGMTRRKKVKFRNDYFQEVTLSILLYEESPLLKQLIYATNRAVSSLVNATNSHDLVGKECVVEVKHTFTGMNIYANVVSIDHIKNYVEVPDEDDEDFEDES